MTIGKCRVCRRTVIVKVGRRKPSGGWLCHVCMKRNVSEHEVFESQVENGRGGGRIEGSVSNIIRKCRTGGHSRTSIFYSTRYDEYLVVLPRINLVPGTWCSTNTLHT